MPSKFAGIYPQLYRISKALRPRSRSLSAPGLVAYRLIPLPHRRTASMESRRRRPAPSQRVKRKRKPRLTVPWPPCRNIAQLIEDGDITIGMLRRVSCAAAAADEDCNYAMLVRRRGKSLVHLLTRFDQAINKALT